VSPLPRADKGINIYLHNANSPRQHCRAHVKPIAITNAISTESKTTPANLICVRKDKKRLETRLKPNRKFTTGNLEP